METLQQCDSIEIHAPDFDYDIDGSSVGSTFADQELPITPSNTSPCEIDSIE